MRTAYCLLRDLEASFIKEYAPVCLQLGTDTTRKLRIEHNLPILVFLCRTTREEWMYFDYSI
jgi:hypothetical protein